MLNINVSPTRCSALFRLAAASVVAGSASLASAAVIRSPESASSPTVNATLPNLINHSGLAANNFSSGISDFDDYMATNPLHAADGYNSWAAGSNGDRSINTQSVFLALDAVYSVSGMATWFSDDYEPSHMSVWVSQDNSLFWRVVDDTQIGTFAHGVDTPAVNFSWAAANIRYARIDFTCVRTVDALNWCSVGEIAFRTETQSVPEPASWALGLAGLAGLQVRRLRKQHQPQASA